MGKNSDNDIEGESVTKLRGKQYTRGNSNYDLAFGKHMDTVT